MENHWLPLSHGKAWILQAGHAVVVVAHYKGYIIGDFRSHTCHETEGACGILSINSTQGCASVGMQEIGAYIVGVGVLTAEVRGCNRLIGTG